MTEVKKMPAHVAIIMDGNGRWSSKNGVPKLSGHNAGMLSMIEIVKKADEMGIKYLTVYAFSTENWKRSEEEVGGIFSLLIKFVELKLKELNEKGVRLNILGDYSKIPSDALKSVERAITATKDNTGLQFNIALNYGGRDEILRAVKNIAADVKSGKDIEITEELVSKRLYTGELSIPDPDLIIRTSGEMRLSNFLLWQCAYSEFAFTKTLWPDFTPEEFSNIVNEFLTRDRRFGGRAE